MPRPAYIIFANSGAIDQFSDAVSMFDVVETFPVIDRSKVPGRSDLNNSAKPQRIVAVWLREESDGPADLFQGQIVCLAPDGSELFVSERDDFAFTEPFYRWNSELVLPGFTRVGTHVIEARLRRVGDQEWTWRQTFPFLVQAQEAPPLATEPQDEPQ